MNNITKEAEIIQLSLYCDIIMAIIRKKKMLSVNKIITFAYLLKKKNYLEQDVFKGNSTKGLVIKALSLLNGLRDDYFSNITYIFSAIDILIGSEKISLEKNIISLCDKEYNTSFTVGMFFEKTIEASDLFTDRQFLKEVLNNV